MKKAFCLLLALVGLNAYAGGAKVSIGSQTLTPFSWLTVPFTSSNADFDTSSYIGTNEFVAQNSGIHEITVFANSGAASDFVSVQYQVNSNGWVQLCLNSNSGANSTCNGSEDLDLSQNDTVEFRVTSDGTSVSAMRISISQR